MWNIPKHLSSCKKNDFFSQKVKLSTPCPQIGQAAPVDWLVACGFSWGLSVCWLPTPSLAMCWDCK